MAKYKVVDENGVEIVKGSTIVDFRGDKATFECVSRGPEYNGTAKVIAVGDGFRSEYYAGVFNLVVTTVGE